MPLTQESAARKDERTARADVTFTHKQFAKIAAIIRTMPDFATTLRTQKQSTINTFADALSATNPRFDAQRFRNACGERELREREA